MKKFYLLLAFAYSTTAQAQTLITYGNNTVSKDEFLRAYNKNKTPVTDKEKSIRDYIDLYTNFKLKVKAARDLHIDTLPQLQADIENFRKQVDENYMNDEKGLNALISQAFDRSQFDLHVMHFLLPIPDDAIPEDTLKVFTATQNLYNQLKSGRTDYNALAESNNAKSGDLGFITAFTLPYQYENIVYALKPGETSTPYRTKKGWHIFKLIEQRKDAGKWKVAQIMLTYPPDADAATKQHAQQLADSIYNLLQSGIDFAALAKTYSNDKLTYLNGGEMPEFGSGKFDASFENQVFSLAKDGDYTKPFTTAFGIHIVKRLGFTPTSTDKNDAAVQQELKQKVMQDARISEAKEKFAKEIISKIGYKRVAAVKDEDLFKYADSISVHDESDVIREFPINYKPIISFAKGTLKGADWLKFVKEYKNNYDKYKGESNKELWDKFITISSLEYYRNHLEEYNEDFKFQMQEFREGNMLFEVMERNVWTKAGQDSAGLLSYYNEHKQNYKWAESADVLIVNCISEKVAQEAIAALKAGKAFRQLVEERNNEIQADSARYEISQINGSSNTFTAGKDNYSSILKNSDGTATFIRYFKFYPANEQRNFEDARGLVINDYQNVLEQKWLADLKKKYPVKINEALVKTMVK